MRVFGWWEIRQALEYAVKGGQALHVFRADNLRPDSPRCFRRAKIAAHLLDRNAVRLVATAKRLGVCKPVVMSRGTSRQHVDLCGSPLAKAFWMSSKTNDARLSEN